MIAHALRLLTVFLILVLTSCIKTTTLIELPKKELPLPCTDRLKPRVVLVLGSGGSKGFAHAGVLKVLEENHIPIDLIVGTSAGSIVGALYADKPRAQSLVDLFLTTKRDEVIDFSLMHLDSGFFKGEQLQNYLTKHMKARTFDQLSIPFFAVATNLKTGKAHAFGSGPIAPTVNASSAIPPFFSPVSLYGKYYVDGGFVDPVAVDVARRFHPKMIIAVNLDSSLAKDLPTANPGILLRSLELMSRQLNLYSLSTADVVIRPKSVDLSMFDGSKRAEQITAGEKAAYKVLPKIKQLLKENKILSNSSGT